MRIIIDITRPHRHSPDITRSGKKNKGKQNYRCKGCGRQFKSDQEDAYKGTLSGVKSMIKIMSVRGVGIRDIGITLKTSGATVLKAPKSTKYRIKPKQSRYDCLETDEFWTYVGKKKNKVWLIYAYHRESGEIVAFVWGKRDVKTAQKLRKRINGWG
jgi:transposase-like protein